MWTKAGTLAYLVCLAGFVWLGYDSLRFRQSIRDSVRDAHSLMHQIVPEHATDAGKVLNSYYEDVYAKIPAVVLPAGMLFAGATVLMLLCRSAASGAATNNEP